MFITAVFFIAQLYALNYKRGETFSYHYKSDVKTVAANPVDGSKDVFIGFECQANFKVLLVSAKGAYLQMIMSQVTSTGRNCDQSSGLVQSQSLDTDFSNPIYFTQAPDGSITDVAAHKDDNENMVQMKVAVIYSLRTSVTPTQSGDFEQVKTIDPQGYHYEYVQSSTVGDQTMLTSHFTEEDVVFFRDEQLSYSDISIESSRTHQVSTDHVISSSSKMNIVFLPRNGKSNSQATEVSHIGQETLNGYVQGNTETISTFPYASAIEHQNSNEDYLPLVFLSQEFYRDRKFSEKPVVDSEIGVDGGIAENGSCFGATDYCYFFDETWTIGDPDCGVTIHSTGQVGTAKHCPLTTISPFYVDSHNVAESLVQGTATRAASLDLQLYVIRKRVSLLILQFQLFDKTYPISLMDSPCTDISEELDRETNGTKRRFSVCLFILTITLEISTQVTHSLSMEHNVCADNGEVMIRLIPRITQSLTASYSLDTILIKGGLDLQGIVSAYYNPTGYVSYNKCMIGFSIESVTDPYVTTFSGWIQLRKNLFGKWGSKQTHIFWKHSSGGKRELILKADFDANPTDSN